MGRRPAKKLGAVPPAAKKQLYQRNVQIADINRQPSTVQKRGEPVTQISRKPAKKTEKPEFDVSDCGGSFWDNFLATLHRTVQQKKRDWVSTLLELLIPIIFIVGTIVIWAAFGTANNPAGSKFVTSPITNGIPAYTTAYYDQMVCNNASNNRKYTLRSCETATYTADCSGDESSLPDGVRGICVDDVYNATQVVGMYVNSAAGNPAIVPPLDSILVYQWLARKAQASLGVDVAALSLSSSGIVSKTRYDSIMCSGKIFFTPDNAVTKGLINYINSTSENFQYVNGGAVGSIEEATELAKNTDTMAIIEVKAFDKSNFNVDIHMNASALPNSASVVDPSYPGGYQYDRGEMYVVSGFSTLQKLVYEYYFESQQGLTSAQSVFEIYLVSTPWVAYISKQLLEYAAILISFIIVLAFLYPVSQLAKKIVLEKELRIREAMLIMGLSNTALYLVWFVVYALQNFFLCIVLTILLKVTYITKSNPFLLFMTLFVFALTTIPLAGLIASFFSKARLASLLAPLIFFVISVPTFAFTSASSDVILGVSIFSPTAFASAMNAILTRESAEGFHDSDFHYNRLEPIPYYLWIFMACDFVVYYLLMLYFDAVLPKDWGTRKHPLFFIIEPFKKCQNGDKGYAPNYGEDGRAEDGVFEEYDEEGLAVNIVGLRKEYKRSGKKFCALNNFYWGLKPNEISILLGHNGAGKSTCLNLITGMTTPDEGDCFIFGYSIIEQMGDIRKRIGYCPQHNILWPELTCREHLEYFGRIKGLRGGELEDAVTIVMDEVDLIEKMDQQSKSLSGGQMRKLSVAIAFVGRSPLVFLDEPTAGMDVGARRHTWELLRRMSDNHTIMLTTHYMDEADLLGDQIGILSRGRLQCSGSSVFLKSRLGAGYSMTVSLEPGASAEDVDRLVLSYVPGAEAANFNGVEIMYKLPLNESHLFPKLLNGLEETGEEEGVRGYSLSATTLEEIFLQIAMNDLKEDETEKEEFDESAVWNCSLIDGSTARSNSQFAASMTKRFWNALRDRRMQCFQIVCPVLCILLAMVLTLVNLTKSGVITLDGSLFGEEAETEVTNCTSLFGKDFVNTDTPIQSTYYYDRYFLSSTDFNQYLMDTSMNLERPRYTSIFCDSSEFQSGGPTQVLFYNTSAYHAGGLAMTQFYSLLLQKTTSSTARYMHTSSTPLPKRSNAKKESSSGIQIILIGAIVMIPFTFLPSNPIAWVVKERESRSRHLQHVSGLSFSIYWVSNFLFDMAAYLITTILAIIIFLIFQRKEYVSKATIGPTIVMFVTYGFCSTSAAYCLSFAFNEHSSAQTITMALSFVAGFLLVMLVFILSLVETTKQASDIMRWPFRLVPSYCVGESIINLAVDHQSATLGLGQNPWGMDVIGWPCVFMAAEFPVFLFFTFFIDHPKRRMWGQKGAYDRSGPSEFIDDEDSDVEDERLAVYEQEVKEYNEDIVRVVDLRKVYKNGKVAVRNVAFSILPDEVFGFLGTNGAGKTTTIAMLCQEFAPTSGSAYVCGYDVVEDSSEALSCIGYCPQFDASLDLLTVEEHLYLFAGIRGIAKDERKTVVNGLMSICDIDEYAKQKAGQLSGGNRRKLSVAMALIGSPQIVFLDEPSAGMDPVARRGLWNSVQKVSQNCSVVLTTHHLEEVEALADTVAIMADGALRCIGDKIHLKQKYGSGFEMTIRIEDKHLKEEVEAFVKKHFPSATLNEFKGQRFVYALPQDTKLSDTFWTLQENKEAVGITDYSVSQTSIEQVFLKISEEQARRAEEKGKEDILYTRSHATKRKAKGNTTAVRGNRGKRGVLIIDEEEEEDAAAYPSTGGKSGKQHPNPLAMSREEEEVIYGGGGYPDEDYVQPFY